MSESLTSHELVELYRQGNPEAAEEIFHRYVPRLIALVQRRICADMARRVDAEDIVQSTFRSFFVAIDRGKLSFDESGDLWRLLTVMTVNKVRSSAAYHYAGKRNLNAEQKQARVDADGRETLDDLYLIATQPLPDAAAAMAEEYELLVQDLEPEQKEMVRMRLEGYELQEIADAVKRSERTVRRVLEKLRERWTERTAGV
jgi:RNA polymerase sigma factor (sigma-70 family)